MDWIGAAFLFFLVSGNCQLSPLKAQVYSKLEDLSTRLKDIGYELDTSYVLQDIDDEHKEAILAHRSERVAIDFGLIDTEKGLWRLSCFYHIDCKD